MTPPEIVVTVACAITLGVALGRLLGAANVKLHVELKVDPPGDDPGDVAVVEVLSHPKAIVRPMDQREKARAYADGCCLKKDWQWRSHSAETADRMVYAMLVKDNRIGEYPGQYEMVLAFGGTVLDFWLAILHQHEEWRKRTRDDLGYVIGMMINSGAAYVGVEGAMFMKLE